MNVSFEEIGHLSATFPVAECEVGQVCKINAEGKAAPCGAGEKICGFVEGIRGGYAGVQLHGFAKIGYSGSAPVCGFANLTADGNGGIAVNESGKSYLVVKVDTVEKTAVIEL